MLGATGGQGGAVVDALLAREVPVRGLVRDPASSSARRLAARGVEVVPGSLTDRDSLAAAMRGASGVFALTTPFERGPGTEVEQSRAILGAAHDAEAPHLVFSSVAGAMQDSGVPHFESKAVVEREIEAGDVPFTVLGPTSFFDNALGGEDQVRDGVLELPLPADRPLQQLARADLGRFAAAVLAAPESFTGQRVELASDEPSAARMASALGSALGRSVRHEEVPLGSVASRDMHAMWTFLREQGYRVDSPALHSRHPEVGWTTFGQWADQAVGASS